MNKTMQNRFGGVPTAHNGNTKTRFFRKPIAMLLLLAALVMAGGKAWGADNVTWSSGNTYGGNYYGLSNHVIIKVSGTVYINAPITVSSPWTNTFAIPSEYTVTVQPATTGGTCTIKRAPNYTGEIFRIINYDGSNAPNGIIGDTYWGGGHLIIKDGVTFDGENRANCSPFIHVYLANYHVNNNNYSGTCKIQGTSSNHVVFKDNTNSAILNEWKLSQCDYCDFINNSTATSSGGAIGSPGLMKVKHCSFNSNSCNGNGGAIYTNYSGDLSTIESCSFIGNHANVGGAIFNSGKLKITGASNDSTTFKKNYATHASFGSGAIYSATAGVTDPLICEFCQFGASSDTPNSTSNRNYAPAGGAMLSNYAKIYNSSFYYNQASSTQGGAVHNGGTMEFYDCQFIGNYANTNGGAIWNNGTINHLEDCVFYGNHATTNGGAIYNPSNKTLSCTGCTFGDSSIPGSANYANTGGAIYSAGTSLSLDDCIFEGNYTENRGRGGGAVNNASGTMTCTNNCEFNNNAADYTGSAGNYGFGGGILNDGTLSCTDCSFVGNDAYVGGGICSYQKVVTTNCLFQANNGAINGGGFYQNNSSTSDPSTITSCEFDSNTAKAGGGIFSSGYLKIKEANGNPTLIHDNEILSGGTGGGGIFTNGTIDMEGGQIYDNATNIPNGGGVYVALLSHAGDFRLKGTSAIYSNSTTGNGGGVYVTSGATFTMSGSSNIGTSGGNSATRGGGIYSEGTVSINGGQIVNNSSSGSGGGVFVNNGICSITGGTIGTSGNANTAATNGGGMFIASNGTVYIDGGDIEYNEASGDGGGVYQDGTLYMEYEVHIRNNTKSSAANNVYLNTNKKITIDTDGLYCGSSIGINNATNGLNVVTGPVAKVQHAYRNGFFFQDTNAYGVFPSTTSVFAPGSTNLYLANLSGSSINTFPIASGATAGTDYVGSAGGNITQVKTAKGLAFLAMDVFNGNTYANKTVTLANDITFGNSDNWEPIGFRAFSSDDCNGNGTDHPFSGTFNGNGHIITNLHGDPGYRDYGLFGYVLNGTIQNVIIASGTGGQASENIGGLVGYQNGGQIQYCQIILNSLTGISGATAAIGGIVGRLEGGKVHSCSAIPGTLTNGTNLGGLVGTVATNGKLYNSYANTNLAAYGNNSSGDIRNCYVRLISGSNVGTGTYIGTSASNTGTFTAVQTPYLYKHADNKVTVGGATTNLVDKLNSWVGSSSAYAHWSRTMASPINGDYPILMMPGMTCVGTKSGSDVLNYGSSLNTMLGTHNALGDNIYFWGTEGTVASPMTASNTNANVYFAENAAIIHSGSITKAHVGITVDNTNGSAGVHWHMFSPALSNAPLGINYTDNNDWSFSLGHPSGMPYYLFNQKSESSATYGYFPSHEYGTTYPSSNASATSYYPDWDFYCYYEPEYHWINFKRNGNSHHHEDLDPSHPHINYQATPTATTNENESTLIKGKGYLVATAQPTLLEAKGTLNQGTFTIAVTKDSPTYRTGFNFLGNPYQSYFDFDKFADENKALWGGTKTNASYIILDKDGYTYYAYSGSANLITTSANRYLHPHQGFMIVATNAGTASFTNDMRSTTGADFRDEQVNYPLVNLIVTEDDGNRDITTIELGRPEVGGAFKYYDLRIGKGCLYTHYEDQDYAIAFTLPGIDQVGVRFETDEDATYTMTWDMENGEFSYLHLIDNITGSDIDCLQAREYRFSSKTTDFKSRFKLMFGYTGVEEQEDGPSTGSGTFAFIMGNELVVNCGPSTPSTGSGTSGTATLQMFDMTGRQVMSTTVSGTQTTTMLPNVTAGVYVLRLSDRINGTRTQKIVIE